MDTVTVDEMSNNLTLQVAVDMPFDIKSVRSTTHNVNMKVSEGQCHLLCC